MSQNVDMKIQLNNQSRWLSILDTKLKWHETHIWLYLSEDLLLAASAEWAWHEFYVQVHCSSKSRCHSDKWYRTYLNVHEEYCWCTSETR